MDTYKPPIYKEEAFNCPHCGAYAHQRWDSLLTVTACDEQHYGDLVTGVIMLKT